MKNIKINKFNLNLNVVIDETRNNKIVNVILEVGSKVNDLKSNAKSRILKARNLHWQNIDLNNVVVNDISFKTLTSALSFAFGYQASSKQYMAVLVEINNALNALGLATTNTQTTSQTTTAQATTSTQENAQETIQETIQASTQKTKSKLRYKVNYYDLLNDLKPVQANYKDSFLKMTNRELNDTIEYVEFIETSLTNDEYENASVSTCNYVSASDTEILDDDLELDYQKLDDLQLQLKLLLSDNNIEFKIDGTELLTERTFNEYIFAPTLEEGAKVFTKIAKCSKAPDELVDDIYNKLTTKEAEAVFNGIQDIKKIDYFDRVNERFALYFGGAGTGKTTRAMRENPGAKVIIGSDTFDAENLFGRFDTKTRAFVPSALTDAMENGKTIILDEINLFPNAVLTRLQAITDEKPVFYEETIEREVHIKEGFRVVATMNLTKPLPIALLTRAVITDFDELSKNNNYISRHQRMHRKH